MTRQKLCSKEVHLKFFIYSLKDTFKSLGGTFNVSLPMTLWVDLSDPVHDAVGLVGFVFLPMTLWVDLSDPVHDAVGLVGFNSKVNDFYRLICFMSSNIILCGSCRIRLIRVSVTTTQHYIAACISHHTHKSVSHYHPVLHCCLYQSSDS